MASTPTRDLQDEFLAVTRKSQETVVRAIKTWVETVRTVTPKLPSAYVPLADRLPKLPSVTVPFADKLPKPEEVVASGYDFAEHLLALQRKFVEDLLNATGPLIPGDGKSPVTAPAAKREPKPAPVATVPAAPKAEPKPAESAPKPIAADVAPKPVAAKSAPKARPAARAARSTAAKAAPKPAAPRPAPKNTDAG
ncbi:MAG: hypothetical protein ACRDOH_08130 [Streptosporangiaceae bacterium]